MLSVSYQGTLSEVDLSFEAPIRDLACMSVGGGTVLVVATLSGGGLSGVDLVRIEDTRATYVARLVLLSRLGPDMR